MRLMIQKCFKNVPKGIFVEMQFKTICVFLFYFTYVSGQAQYKLNLTHYTNESTTVASKHSIEGDIISK